MPNDSWPMPLAIAIAVVFVATAQAGPALAEALHTATARAVASADGRYFAVANDVPPSLVVLDASRQPIRTIPAASRIAAVCDAPPRRSFVVALKDVAELWEVSYDPQAEPIAVGLIHDFRSREGAFVPGFLNPRRTQLPEPVEQIFFTQDYARLVGTRRDRTQGHVVHLDVRRVLETLDLSRLPHNVFHNACGGEGTSP